jgi:hypothetical protein
VLLTSCGSVRCTVASLLSQDEGNSSGGMGCSGEVKMLEGGMGGIWTRVGKSGGW